VRAAWNALMRRDPEIGLWLDKVRLVGYVEPPRHAEPDEEQLTAAVA
jgi:hypothetical protein